MSDKRQQALDDILTVLEIWESEHAYGPSFRDVALLTNLPLGTVHELVRVLRDRGQLTFDDHRARSIKL